MKVSGASCVVFGGARGIGKEYVRILLQNGAKVLFADVREKEGRETSDEFSVSFSTQCTFMLCDVKSKEAIENVFKEAVRLYGGVNVVINSAGIFKETQWEETIEVNLCGAIRITNAAMEMMGKQNQGEGGVIIHTASIVSFHPHKFGPVYAASKQALAGYVQSVGEPDHFEKSSVRVNAVCPCSVMTDIHTEADPVQPGTESMLQAHKDIARVPAVDVAKAMLQLVEDDSLNGQCIVSSHAKGNFLHDTSREKFYSDLW